MQNIVLVRAGLYFSCIFVVPFLTILSFALLIVGIIFPLATALELFGTVSFILRQFGVDYPVRFNLGPIVLPSFLNIPVSIIIGILFIYLSRKLWYAFKLYMIFVQSV